MGNRVCVFHVVRSHRIAPKWASERYLAEELGGFSARRQRYLHKPQIAQGK
jgi:hypothetical protein